MTPSYVWHDSFIRVTWLLHMRDMDGVLWVQVQRCKHKPHLCDTTALYVWRDVFNGVTWLLPICDMARSHMFDMNGGLWVQTQRLCQHTLHLCDIKWLLHTFDTTPSYMWLYSFIRVKKLLHTCDMTLSYEWHDFFIRVTCLLHICIMTLS